VGVGFNLLALLPEFIINPDDIIQIKEYPFSLRIIGLKPVFYLGVNFPGLKARLYMRGNLAQTK
jgi:hypothetical protein